MPTLNTNTQGKVCIVTGANSGIGRATALGLAQMGATVVMVCRSQVKGEEAQHEIKEKSGNNTIDLMLADLASHETRQARFWQRYLRVSIGTERIEDRPVEAGFQVAQCSFQCGGPARTVSPSTIKTIRSQIVPQ